MCYWLFFSLLSLLLPSSSPFLHCFLVSSLCIPLSPSSLTVNPSTPPPPALIYPASIDLLSILLLSHVPPPFFLYRHPSTSSPSTPSITADGGAPVFPPLARLHSSFSPGGCRGDRWRMGRGWVGLGGGSICHLHTSTHPLIHLSFISPSSSTLPSGCFFFPSPSSVIGGDEQSSVEKRILTVSPGRKTTNPEKKLES